MDARISLFHEGDTTDLCFASVPLSVSSNLFLVWFSGGFSADLPHGLLQLQSMATSDPSRLVNIGPNLLIWCNWQASDYNVNLKLYIKHVNKYTKWSQQNSHACRVPLGMSQLGIQYKSKPLLSSSDTQLKYIYDITLWLQDYAYVDERCTCTTCTWFVEARTTRKPRTITCLLVWPCGLNFAATLLAVTFF